MKHPFGRQIVDVQEFPVSAGTPISSCIAVLPYRCIAMEIYEMFIIV
jgi:hypothetical protein